MRAACIFVGLLLLIGCSSSGDNNSGSVGNAEVTATIDASGGTLTAKDGSFSLIIPAGALSRATEITVREIEPAQIGSGTARPEGGRPRRQGAA